MRRHHHDREGGDPSFDRGPGWDPRDPRDPRTRGPRQGIRRGGPGGPGFGRGRPPFGFGPVPGGRARKGDMQAAILRLLNEQPMHGYQVIQELANRSGGAWNPGPGSVYPTLQAMEDQELITHESDGSRNVYSLTDKGKAAAADAGHGRPQNPWDEMAEASGPRIELRQAVHSRSSPRARRSSAARPTSRSARRSPSSTRPGRASTSSSPSSRGAIPGLGGAGTLP
ncbi:MAG: PadR family transcriptional regulator [Chloroflexota bacterium]